MPFAERYASACGSSNLLDDPHHHATDPLMAAALADKSGASGLGSLLSRVKYVDGTTRKSHEGGTANLAQLLRLWTDTVIEKGRARRWVGEKTPWDAEAAQKFYRRVAEASMAYWLDGRCGECKGAKVLQNHRACQSCKGSGRAEIKASSRFETDRVKDMVNELEGLVQAHNARAAYELRRPT